MKSLANWAEELQGWDGGKRGTDSSSGRLCASSSSPSPNPSAAVKASRSGDPIIFEPWGGGGALDYTSSAEANIAGAAARTVDRPSPGLGSLRESAVYWQDAATTCRVAKFSRWGSNVHSLERQERRFRPLGTDSDSRINKQRTWSEKRKFPAGSSHKVNQPLSRDLCSSFWKRRPLTGVTDTWLEKCSQNTDEQRPCDGRCANDARFGCESGDRRGKK